MSKPTEEEIKALKNCQGDDESYHAVFDGLLESKLTELDPEWMKAMTEIYGKSGMSRWCA